MSAQSDAVLRIAVDRNNERTHRERAERALRSAQDRLAAVEKARQQISDETDRMKAVWYSAYDQYDCGAMNGMGHASDILDRALGAAVTPTEPGWKCASCGWATTDHAAMRAALWPEGSDGRVIALACPNCHDEGNFVDYESVTPTPQETHPNEYDDGAQTHPGRVEDCAICRSTPEAATTRPYGERSDLVDIPLAPPSGLQRATEQQ